MSKALNERKAVEHEMLKRMAAKWRQERDEWAARPGAQFTSPPEPPGDGWNTVLNDEPAFAAAGECELWRMDLEAGAPAFFRFSDFPPGFNFSGMWWRKITPTTGTEAA